LLKTIERLFNSWDKYEYMEKHDKKSLNENLGALDIKQKIIDTASILFAEKSFEGASIREIASQSNVNIAMISYYFGGKEGLYLECIAKFAQGRGEAIQKILVPVKTTEEFKLRLKLFFESMMALYASDKHLVRIIMREAQTERGEEFHRNVMTHLHPVFLKVQQYYEMALENGLIKKKTDPQMLATITMALISHPCMMEKAIVMTTGIKIESSDYQSHYIKQICDTLFSGVLL
jgi:TetR/AcrR family transcriptional regulator